MEEEEVATTGRRAIAIPVERLADPKGVVWRLYIRVELQTKALTSAPSLINKKWAAYP